MKTNLRWFSLVVFIPIFLAGCIENANQTSLLPSNTVTPSLEAQPTASIANCQNIPIKPTPAPNEASLFPMIQSGEHIRGEVQAEVTIIEYADFQCPSCATLATILKDLEEKYPQDLRLVFRQLPLYDIHDKALLAAQASEVAARAGKFWEMHDLLFTTQDVWSKLNPAEFSTWLVDQSSALNLDTVKFGSDLVDPSVVDKVQKDLVQALSIGLNTTPFLLINGQMYSGPRDFTSLDQIISLILLGEKQFASCPDFSIDLKKQYIAIIKTTQGNVTLELFADKAPITVNSFVFLARHGWYDDNYFYHIVPGSLVETGDPTGTGLGNPGYLFDNEIVPVLNFNEAGMVAMDNFGLNTNGSQFFITLAPRVDFNGDYTIFGKVLDGMDVVRELVLMSVNPNENQPSGDHILSVEILEK